MKKTRFLSVIASLAVTASMFAGCGSSSGAITVISREDGSGTRGAFIELTGVEEKDSDGNKTDKTTTEALICKSTDVVLTQVSGDKNAIGYISLGSLNDTVKTVKVGGTEPSTENVENGSYEMVRPFNIIVKDGISEAAQDFENFIMSKEGQEVIADSYIAVNKSAEAFSSNGASGKIVVAGSSSVTPIMEKLAEEFKKYNANIEIEVQQSDSSTGVKSAIDGTCDIGMASRDLKDDETGVTQVTIAKDAIAVIVNKDNSVDDLTVDQIKSIYIGETTEWSAITE